jgi:hypothetical protein
MKQRVCLDNVIGDGLNLFDQLAYSRLVLDSMGHHLGQGSTFDYRGSRMLGILLKEDSHRRMSLITSFPVIRMYVFMGASRCGPQISSPAMWMTRTEADIAVAEIGWRAEPTRDSQISRTVIRKSPEKNSRPGQSDSETGV